LRFPKRECLKGFSDEVVASSIGRSIFWIDASDSPSLARTLETAFPNALRMCSLSSASTCSRARASPVEQLTALSAIT
jgi:hypothetical protein